MRHSLALIAHYIVGTECSPAALRTAALFGLWSLVLYAIYLLAVYWLDERLPLAATSVAATAAWTIGAALLVAAWSRVYPAGA